MLSTRAFNSFFSVYNPYKLVWIIIIIIIILKQLLGNNCFLCSAGEVETVGLHDAVNVQKPRKVISNIIYLTFCMTCAVVNNNS